MSDPLQRNPYSCGHPVSGREFHGRSDELSRIVVQVERGGHYCVVGTRNMGKTSLLLQLRSSKVLEQHGLQSPDLVPAYCDAARKKSGQTTGGYLAQAIREALREKTSSHAAPAALQSVLETLEQLDPGGRLRHSVRTAGKVAGKALGKLYRGLRDAIEPHLSLGGQPGEDTDGLEVLEETASHLNEQGLRPLLLIDNADRLFIEASDHFLARLRRLFQDEVCSFVLALSRPLRELTASPIETLTLNLGVLTSEDAERLLVEPARQIEVDYSTKQVEQTLATVGPHPYLLQTYAFHLFPSLRDGRSPDQTRLRREVLEAARYTLEAQVRSLGGQEHLLLEALVHDREAEPDPGAQGTLRSEGFVASSGQLLPLHRDFLTHEYQPVEPEAKATGSEFLEVLQERARLERYLREKFTRSATFVDIDIVGSTAMKVGEDVLNVIYSMEEFHRWQGEAVAACGGEVLNSVADETMSMFEKPEDAIACLQLVHNQLPVFNATRNRLAEPFRYRAGVHMGEVIRGEGDRAHGRGLDIAGHLQKLAETGTALMSEAVYEALGSPDYMEKGELIERDNIMTYVFKPTSNS